ncbi:MAG: MarR family winged helix-turn-helix transcriptional regulator [Solirubrobacteraceae bacterium]
MNLSSDFTDSSPGAPRPLIGALLRIPLETVRDRMLAGLHQSGYTDLTAAHLTVLQYPGPDNVRPSDLAARTRMSKQALNYLLGQLQQLGYLTRGADDADQRAKRIRLTPRGHAAITAIRDAVAAVEAEWEHQLGAENMAHLRDLLTQLHTITAPTPDEFSSRDSPLGGAGRRSAEDGFIEGRPRATADRTSGPSSE